MERYSGGARGESVINGAGFDQEEGGSLAFGDAPISISTGPVMQFNSTDYVTQEEFAAGVNVALSKAKSGALRKLQSSQVINAGGSVLMTTEFALGHYFRLIADDATVKFRLQNFFLGENVTHENYTYIFSPFGFSGLSIQRGSDLEPLQLVFPNTEISRGYLDDSLRG